MERNPFEFGYFSHQCLYFNKKINLKQQEDWRKKNKRLKRNEKKYMRTPKIDFFVYLLSPPLTLLIRVEYVNVQFNLGASIRFVSKYYYYYDYYQKNTSFIFLLSSPIHFLSFFLLRVTLLPCYLITLPSLLSSSCQIPTPTFRIFQAVLYFKRNRREKNLKSWTERIKRQTIKE